MRSSSKIILLIFNFFILLWLVFALQRLLDLGVNIKYLNIGISVGISSLISYFISKKQLNFDTVLKYSAISWAIGFILGIAYILLFDPGEAQGIFLSILWTAPIAWIIGMLFSLLTVKKV